MKRTKACDNVNLNKVVAFHQITFCSVSFYMDGIFTDLSHIFFYNLHLDKLIKKIIVIIRKKGKKFFGEKCKVKGT